MKPNHTMKKLLLILGLLVALPCAKIIGQETKNKLGEVTKLWTTKYVPLKDGLVHKYKIYSGYDTAIYYQAGPDTFEVVATFKKISSTKPPDPPLPDLITTMDDNTASVAQTYNPASNLGDNVQNPTGWTHFKDQVWNAPFYNKTGSVLQAAGYVELSCSCYKVEWWAEKRVNHGIVAISIDGGTAVNLDLYDPRTDNNSLLVWTSPDLTNANHKIRIAWTGNKNTASTANNFVHDKFVIYTKQGTQTPPTTPPPPAPQPGSRSIPVSTFVIIILLLIIVILIYLRFKKSNPPTP